MSINIDQLRELLFRQAKVLSDEAIKDNGQLSAEQVHTLERLDRLVKICDVANPDLRRKRWLMVTLLVGTLIIVSILLFARVSETDIELDVVLSGISFDLPTQHVLTDVMKLSSLGVSGLKEVHLPRARGQVARTLTDFAHSDIAINLSITSNQEREGTITLSTLVLPAETSVGLMPTEIPLEYRMSLKSPDLELRTDVNGPIQIRQAGAKPKKLYFSSPRSILLQAGAQIVDVNLTFKDTSIQNDFVSQLTAENLSLLRIDEFVDNKRTVVRRLSTILSGTLYFESLNGRQQPLRAGEDIRFKESYGEIRSLKLHDGQIRMKFYGRVSGMSAGTGEIRRNLMPTYLEWLSARHGLSLLWGTTLYLFGLIAGVLRWLGKLK